MFTRKRRAAFGLNTTSTADISFVLLIFFLVTTSMDQDKGLTRQLPPAETKEQPATEVDSRDVLTYTIKATNQLMADGQVVPVSGVAARVEQFVTSRGRRHIISLQIDPAADYDTYFQLQNQLVAAYQHLRDRTAHQLYGHGYNACTPAQRDAVRSACPQRIVESYQGQGGPHA